MMMSSYIAQSLMERERIKDRLRQREGQSAIRQLLRSTFLTKAKIRRRKCWRIPPTLITYGGGGGGGAGGVIGPWGIEQEIEARVEGEVQTSSYTTPSETAVPLRILRMAHCV